MKKVLLLCLLLCSIISLWAEKPRRYVELGVDVDAGAANNYLGLFDIFNQERTILIEPSKLSDSGAWISGAGAGNVFLNINFGEKFGLGFFTGFDAVVYGNISEEIFRLLVEGNANMRDFTTSISVGASAFVDAGLKTSFKFGKLSLDVIPAAYVPVIYVPPPEASFHVDTTEGINVNINMNVNAYTPLSLDGMVDLPSGSGETESGGKDRGDSFSFTTADVWHILEAWGLDTSLRAEYALSPRWDLGATIHNIPLYPATLRHGISYSFDYEMDPLQGKTISDLINDDGPEFEDFEAADPVYYDDLAFRVFRPLRFDFYAGFKPFSTNLIVLKPNIGFSALTVYGYEADKMCFNAGLEAQLNLKRIFSLTLASGYREKIWRHGVGLTLNLRVFQLDLGAALASQDFVGSFNIQGAEAAVGLRLGF